jgi:hypothetical protein
MPSYFDHPESVRPNGNALDMQGHHDLPDEREKTPHPPRMVHVSKQGPPGATEGGWFGFTTPAPITPSPLAHVWADVLRWRLADEDVPVGGAAIRRHYERDLQRLDQAIRADERQRLIADDEAHMNQGRTE